MGFHCYKRICKACVLVPIWDPLKVKVLACVWKSKVHRKFFIFGWRLVVNKLPTRMKLAKWGIIEGVHNMVCPYVF